MLKLVLPDPPFFDTKQLEDICNQNKVELVIYKDLALDAEQLHARIYDANIIIVDILSTYNEAVLGSCKQLRHIITASVGMNHIDVEYCKNHNITVSNIPKYNARAVAEMSFANLISLLRRIPYANFTVRSSLWLTEYFAGEELKGKTLGIVGAGNIGQELIKIGQGFDMEILCNTKHPNQKRAKTLGINKFYELNTVFCKSDFIILAATANSETQSIVNAKTLKLMQPGAYIINMARESLVDIEALANALYKKQIAGAALDFVGPEPYRLYNDNLLIQEMVNRPNVIVTPHIGFNTKESVLRLEKEILSRVDDIMLG